MVCAILKRKKTEVVQERDSKINVYPSEAREVKADCVCSQ